MKLAIIGSGPLGILSAQHFNQLGADITLFHKNDLGGSFRFMVNYFPQLEVIYCDSVRPLDSFWKEHLESESLGLLEKGLLKKGEVLRVHKRFLHPDEEIEGKSRLHDLFRVVYSVNPKEAILKQLEENPKMFKGLGEKVIASLHLPVESFMDFDIVIECRGHGRATLDMGPSDAMALNENNLKNNSEIFYEKEIFNKFSFEGKKQLVLIGSSETAALSLINSKDWLLKNTEHSVSFITHLSLRDFIENQIENAWIKKEFKALLSLFEDEHEKEKNEFEIKIREWRDLEDYIKAKIPMPKEPKAKIAIYEGHTVTSVDRLLDREELFVTIETPDFRNFTKTQNDLMTLSCDAIWVANGVKIGRSGNDVIAKGIKENEPGYYYLEEKSVSKGLESIKEIEKKILGFFTRNE